MLQTLQYPTALLTDRVYFTPADHALFARCRGAHNRLGLAYQLGFLRLTGRFPHQDPLERLLCVGHIFSFRVIWPVYTAWDA